MTPTPFRENLRGIVSLSVCNLLFIINDMMMKLASEHGLPLSQLLFLRGLFAVPILVVAVVLTRSYVHWRLLRNRGVFWRISGEAFGATSYLTALFVIPFANANTIAQLAPLAITAAAAIFFREPVGWRRWTAIAVGFLGVLIVVRPGFAGFNAASLLAVASVAFLTVRDLATRLMSAALPALLVALLTAFVMTFVGLGYGFVRGDIWPVPPAGAVALVAGASVFLIGGYVTSIDFMRHGDISVSALFRYTAIVYAIVIGLLVWHEIPDVAMIVGMAIIAAAGIYTFRRERNLARLAEEATAGEGV